MSLLKYLNNTNEVDNTKINNIEYLHIISELKKSEKIDLFEYTNLNNFAKDQSIININKIIKLFNKNISNEKKVKIKDNFPKIFSLKDDNLIFNNNIYNNFINNNLIKFSNNQEEAINKLFKFLISSKQKTYGLYGYAGTGKTTTLVECVAYLLEHKLIKTVALTAPTNKAVNIIKAKFRYHLKKLAKTELDLSFDDLVDILEKKGIKIDFITIHKLLNYKNDFDTEGDKVFLRNGKTNINDYDLVIIDECSMIPYMIINNIYEDIRNNTQTTKILFSGDICQLPPVNESKSIIFLNIFKKIKLKQIMNYEDLKKYYSNLDTVKGKKKFKIEFDKDYYDKLINDLEIDLLNMKYFTLTEVVRTKFSNVINLCYNIREWIDNIVKYPEIRKFIGNGVHIYKKNDQNKINSIWFEKYMEYHNSLKPEHSSNIILAWTNKQCELYNNSIRQIIFKNKKNINKYEIGDILILNDFYIFDETIEKSYKKEKDNNNRFYTSEQIKITDIEVVTKKCIKFTDNLPKYLLNLKNIEKIENKFKQYISKINSCNFEYKCWKMYVKKVQELVDNNNLDTNQIYVIHEDSQKILDNDRNKILDEIRKLKWELEKNPNYNKTMEKYIFKQIWKEWSKIFNEPFANVNIGCSISCHKSQSSTYYNVFVDADDILNNNNDDEAKRCIYTALTRASNEIHILI